MKEGVIGEIINRERLPSIEETYAQLQFEDIVQITCDSVSQVDDEPETDDSPQEGSEPSNDQQPSESENDNENDNDEPPLTRMGEIIQLILSKLAARFSIFKLFI